MTINNVIERHIENDVEEECNEKISTIIGQLEYLLESANSLKQDKEIALNNVFRI